MSIFIPTIPHLKIPTFSYPLIKEGKKGHQETLTANIKLSFSLKGQLFHDTSGLVYLKVDRALAQSLIKQIDAEIESSFDDLYPFHGAHIAVIAPTLSRQYHLLGSVKETGERYFFGINKIIKETLYNHPEIDTIWYVAIESNSLDQLQRKYLGYTSPLYLILGVKKKELAHQAFQDTYFRTNDAFNFV
ncbi:MAG: hypothetical protein HY860_05495 [Chlamydiales bacterium]|nr:hypothetical protein [Chlamydiales bacterium]